MVGGDDVVPHDAGGGTAPRAALYSLLMFLERDLGSEQFGNSPGERVVGGLHLESKAPGFRTRQLDVSRQMLGNRRRLIDIRADETSRQSDVVHDADTNDSIHL